MAIRTYIQALNNAMDLALEKDPRVLIFGEDVGKAGGVFLATQGLQEKYGKERVFDTPLTETGIIGFAVGLALYGLRPVAEIQFIDFIFTGFDQIVSEIAKMRYRSGGQFICPVVIRAPSGGGIKGGHYHSQSNESYFIHTPGLKVVMPAFPYDVKGLFLSSLEDEDPVIFLEPKKLYRSIKEEVPDEYYTEPIGKAKVIVEGKDVTIIAWGNMVHSALKAVEKLKEKGIEPELIDLRTLLPFDKEAILQSVKKTGRVVIAQESPKILGFASEISAFINEKALDYLLAPIVRVSGFDTPYPYALDALYFPSENRVIYGVQKVLNY